MRAVIGLAVAWFVVVLCGGGTSVLVREALAGGSCQTTRTCPAKDGSYSWRPLAGAAPLVCYSALAGAPAAFDQLLDFRGAGYLCRLPAPRDMRVHGSIDFFGPQTVSAGPVPLKQDELRLTIDAIGRQSDVLQVDWGDGASWQRALGQTRFFDITHSYVRTHTYYLLVTLRDQIGYVAVEGVGPFRGPAPGPRARRCRYEAWGKGWTLSASEALTCAEAQQLFSVYRRRGELVGYRCRSSGLPPYGSDVFVDTCVNGSRLFVLTSNP